MFVVDDESDARELLGTVLEGQGAKVTSFASAPEALAALKLTNPTVLICDIGMPIMDGYQFIRQLRAEEPRSERIPRWRLRHLRAPKIESAAWSPATIRTWRSLSMWASSFCL